jgi:DNA-binding NtrC family response regulator
MLIMRSSWCAARLEESLRQAPAEEELEAVPEILGQAPAMQDVFRAIGRLSANRRQR